MEKEEKQIIASAVLFALNKLAEISINWNNPEYVPPSADEILEYANKIQSLPDLPTA